LFIHLHAPFHRFAVTHGSLRSSLIASVFAALNLWERSRADDALTADFDVISPTQRGKLLISSAETDLTSPSCIEHECQRVQLREEPV
jgi:hypothetical protein